MTEVGRLKKAAGWTEKEAEGAEAPGAETPAREVGRLKKAAGWTERKEEGERPP